VIAVALFVTLPPIRCPAAGELLGDSSRIVEQVSAIVRGTTRPVPSLLHTS
jgi:hypothetical protein